MKNYVSFIIISGASWLKESCTRSSVANTGAFFDGSQKVRHENLVRVWLEVVFPGVVVERGGLSTNSS